MDSPARAKRGAKVMAMTESTARSGPHAHAGVQLPPGNENVERIVVIGLGYVGLPAALCLAKVGFHVTGADINTRVVDSIRRGVSPLKDSVKDEEIREAVEAGRFTATTDTVAAVREADFIMVCVPTPVDHAHKPDLTPLQKASIAIGRGIQRGAVVSYESTTFPGCTERECVPLIERESGLKAGADFGVSYCPERLNPGDNAHTTEITPRVLGALDERSLRIANRVYSSFLKAPLHLCKDIRTAECSKVLENIQRDVNIALVNEFAAMAPLLGLDAHEVLRAARTKYNFVPVSPGPGVGGHCIPVDPYYLIEEARRAGYEPRLMAMAREVNDAATERMADAILDGVSATEDAKVAVLGLSYKGGVGDLRESPSLRLLDILRPKVRILSVHDPYVEPDSVEKATKLASAGVEDAARGAHAIALLTDHPEFKRIDWARVAKLAAPGAVVVDGHNVVDPETVRAHGMRYWGVGRGSA